MLLFLEGMSDVVNDVFLVFVGVDAVSDVLFGFVWFWFGLLF